MKPKMIAKEQAEEARRFMMKMRKEEEKKRRREREYQQNALGRRNKLILQKAMTERMKQDLKKGSISKGSLGIMAGAFLAPERRSWGAL